MISITESFDSISAQYDQQRKQLIPCFDDFYHLALTVLDYPGDTPSVLDMGSGTGLFSEIVLKKYPKAKLTLIDLSENMLTIARQRFSGKSDVIYLQENYLTHEFDQPFDFIISALSIHHLAGCDKQKLYRKCASLLPEGGVFINADQVLSPFDTTEALFSNQWKAQVESSGLSHDAIKKAYERLSYDKPSTMADQLSWLLAGGFKEADVLYKYYHFCVLYAKK